MSARAAPRVLYYCHDALGLGHTRRTWYVARTLARLRPDAVQLMLTSTLRAEAAHLPPNFDYVRLPPASNANLYQEPGGRTREQSPWRGVWSVREALIQATADAFAPDLLLVDDNPAGLERELVRTLACLSAAPGRPRVVLGMDQFVHEPGFMRRHWQATGAWQLLENIYTRILIYGDPTIWDAPALYHFPASLAAKTRWCGYILNDARRRPAAELRAELGFGAAQFVVVSAGGGEMGGRLLDTYLATLRLLGARAPASLIVTGPHVDNARYTALERAVASLPRVRLTNFVDDLDSWVAAADLFIGLGGTSLYLPLATGTRTISVPNDDPRNDQLLRSGAFSERGLIAMLRHADLTPERLAQVVGESLAGPPPATALQFDGAQRVAEELAELLDE